MSGLLGTDMESVLALPQETRSSCVRTLHRDKYRIYTRNVPEFLSKETRIDTLWSDAGETVDAASELRRTELRLRAARLLANGGSRSCFETQPATGAFFSAASFKGRVLRKAVPTGGRTLKTIFELKRVLSFGFL